MPSLHLAGQAAKVVAATAALAIDEFVFAGAGGPLVEVVKLVYELHGSSAMCLELSDKLQALENQLHDMLTGGSIHRSRSLHAYARLVEQVQHTLASHVKCGVFMRMLKHMDLKDRVDGFYREMDWIAVLMDLEFQQESAERHDQVSQALATEQRRSELAQRDLAAQLSQVLAHLETKQPAAALPLNEMMQWLVDFKAELKANATEYTPEQVETMREVLRKAMKEFHVGSVPHVSAWHMSDQNVLFDVPFKTDDMQDLYYGTLASGAQVTVRTIKINRNDRHYANTIANFEKEAALWYSLNDPHVLPLYGANKFSNPPFYVCGRTEHGSFTDYIPTHRHRLWHIFVGAARGLLYLHKHGNPIVHGNLKCNNLLVTSQGDGVVSDFAFAFVRANSNLSFKPQPPECYWKAPEAVCENNPRPESDVYSLGMCLLEAFTGKRPYAEMDEATAIATIKDGTLPDWPREQVPDAAWQLIQQMCRKNWKLRPTLDAVVSVMKNNAYREQLQHPYCTCASPLCAHCGSQVAGKETV